jgi:dihydrofolate reductase
MAERFEVVQVSVAAVMSVDGKLTRHDEANIYEWVSDEDQQNFRELIGEQDVIVMGRGSYEAVQQSLKLNPKRLRVVLTTHPEQFSERSINGQLEFYAQSPQQLVASLENRGYTNILVVGGSRMISEFLEAGLVNQLYVTIEPRLFGSGKPLTADKPIDIQLQLEKSQVLNDQGTVLQIYTVR